MHLLRKDGLLRTNKNALYSHLFTERNPLIFLFSLKHYHFHITLAKQLGLHTIMNLRIITLNLKGIINTRWNNI